MTQEQTPNVSLDEIKQKIEATFTVAWNEFLSKIGHLPGHRLLIDRGMRYFDDGFLNFREGIRSLELTPISPLPDQPQDQKQTPVDETTISDSTDEPITV